MKYQDKKPYLPDPPSQEVLSQQVHGRWASGVGWAPTIGTEFACGGRPGPELGPPTRWVGPSQGTSESEQRQLALGNSHVDGSRAPSLPPRMTFLRGSLDESQGPKLFPL